MPKLETYGISDVGLVRQNNEDAWLVDDALCVAVVADGMGGAACGEVAAALTIETLADHLRHPPEALPPDQLLKEAVREANRRVLERARQDAACDGMGSTIVTVLWDLPLLLIANVGDSRAYLWRQPHLKQLSYDQTLANELRSSLGLTDEEIEHYNHKNVLTMAIGAGEDVLIHTQTETLEAGDEILLCSDGLYGPTGDQEIARILSQRAPLRQTAEQLVEAAKAAESEDNITVVLLRYKKD